MGLTTSLLILLFSSCSKEDDILNQPNPTEIEDDPNAEIYHPKKSSVAQDLKIVSFNTHEEGKSQLESFRDNYLSSDVQVICLQEVVNPQDVKDVFKVYNESGGGFPYYAEVRNYTKLLWQMTPGSLMSPPYPVLRRKELYEIILSKLPIVEVDTKLIQIDPRWDEWHRHAVYARIKVDSHTRINLFNYHNTYNGGANNRQSEKSGLQSFKNWVETKVGPLSTATNTFLVGDFNVNSLQAQNILGSQLHYAVDWVDFVVSTNDQPKSNSGKYNTDPAISDHNAPWASYNLSTNVSTALDYVARLYEHSNFGGKICSIDLGSSGYIGNLHGSWWNDRVSSVKVGSQVQFAGYEHSNYQGKTYYLPSINGSGTLSGMGMNDKISSTFVVYRYAQNWN